VITWNLTNSLPMKFIIHPFPRAIITTAAWFFCIRKIYIDFDHSFWFDEVAPTLLIILASIISLFSFLVDFSRYKTNKNPACFIPAAFSVLGIAALIITTVLLKQLDNTPSVLYASRFYNGLNTIAIDFRENGTYKCEKGSFLGDSYYSRGHYTIRDSIIYLDKSNLYDLVTTDRLLMKTIPKWKQAKKAILLRLLFRTSKADTLPETFLFQLNHFGDTIPSAIVLRVNKEIVGYHD
jgi:hypothetical protein